MPGFKPASPGPYFPLWKNDTEEDVLTNGASFDLKGFDRFIALNSNTLRTDRGTLLHEMIHCSDESQMIDAEPPHDSPDSDSIFSWNGNRTTAAVKPCQFLNNAFFAR